jgi:hypothetical protein
VFPDSCPKKVFTPPGLEIKRWLPNKITPTDPVEFVLLISVKLAYEVLLIELFEPAMLYSALL